MLSKSKRLPTRWICVYSKDISKNNFESMSKLRLVKDNTKIAICVYKSLLFDCLKELYILILKKELIIEKIRIRHCYKK